VKTPGISILVPVLNETAEINDLLDHLFALDCSDATEVIVVDGDPGGSTLAVITDQNVVKLTAAKGRASQMNAGTALAQGSTILFLHADTRLPPDGLLLIRSALDDPGCVGGAFDLAIDSPRKVFRLIERTASLRSRITRIPFGDQGIFLRRDYFQALGGYAEIPLMEDVELMARIKARGDVIRMIPRCVRTSARRWEARGVLRRTLTNWLIQCLYLCGVDPARLARLYE
jgi:rSAM/selenodomain-associated transferase 2